MSTKKPKAHLTVTKQFFLTPEDRITYVYSTDDDQIIEVVNVSYETLAGKKWTTLVRFDSHYGYLHSHTRVSEKDLTESVSTVTGVEDQIPHELLTWAIKDISTNYLQYKANFMERSKVD